VRLGSLEVVMTVEENRTHAREMLEAFQRGDQEALLELLDPEVEVYSPPQLANAGSFHGREGYLEWSREWFDAWEHFEVDARSIEAVGEHHVLTTVQQRGRGKGSGIEVEMEACYMGEVHDGRATRFHLYQTREDALAAAREGEAGRAPRPERSPEP
jgi:ketosteroid isomerase-like protein